MSIKEDPCHAKDKLALFALAGLVVTVLGVMVVAPFTVRVMPDKTDVLMGVIAAGLIAFLRDLVAAVRTSWEEVTRAETNKQLAQGAAVIPAPQNAADAAKDVAGAAQDRSDEIAGGKE